MKGIFKLISKFQVYKTLLIGQYLPNSERKHLFFGTILPGFLTAKVFNLRVAWQSVEENAEKTQEFHVGIALMNLV